jgi:cyclin B
MNALISNSQENKENPLVSAKVSESLKAPRRFGTDITNSSIKIKEDFSSDPLSLSYYSGDIFNYLHDIESKTSVKSGYLKFQHDINDKMRAILIDWLIDVHCKFKLVPETLFLTIDILDRYLEKVAITKNRLQLVGVTSLFIASKFEDTLAPEVNDLVYITDKSYDRDEIINMEVSILKTLEFNISTPSIYLFLERYCSCLQIDKKNSTFARYLAELTLPDYKMLKYKKSLIAASAVYMMNKIMKIEPEWPETIEKICFYCEEDLKVCAKELCMLLQKAEQGMCQAIKRKFMQPGLFSVAAIHID